MKNLLVPSIGYTTTKMVYIILSTDDLTHPVAHLLASVLSKHRVTGEHECPRVVGLQLCEVLDNQLFSPLVGSVESRREQQAAALHLAHLRHSLGLV